MPIELTFTRTFDASAASVYAAWTDPELVARWWGPHRFTCPSAEMDVRVGGTSFVTMRAPEDWGGRDFPSAWTYDLVEPGRRLVFVHRFVGADRTPVAPQTLGLPDGVPAEVGHVLTFRDLDDGRSEMTITESGYTSEAALDTSRAGLVETLEKLAATLADVAVERR